MIKLQHGFSTEATATTTPGSTFFEEYGERRAARVLSVHNTGSEAVYILVNVPDAAAGSGSSGSGATDALSAVFNACHPIKLASNAVMTFDAYDGSNGPYFKSVGYKTDSGTSTLAIVAY